MRKWSSHEGKNKEQKEKITYQEKNKITALDHKILMDFRAAHTQVGED